MLYLQKYLSDETQILSMNVNFFHITEINIYIFQNTGIPRSLEENVVDSNVCMQL